MSTALGAVGVTAAGNNIHAQPQTSERHFSYGLNIYKLLWIFVFGSVTGCITEMIQCLIKNGYIERRSGLIFGPFNIVYGFGAVALCLCFVWLRNKNFIHIFLIGMIATTGVEYICSFVQEALFGTVSWDYSSMPFNIGGRISLLCSLLWGALTLAWFYFIYPCCEKLMKKIPDSLGRNLARVIFLFLIINMTLSASAVVRWTLRTDGIPASTQTGALIDECFPDEFMEAVYPNMKMQK